MCAGFGNIKGANTQLSNSSTAKTLFRSLIDVHGRRGLLFDPPLVLGRFHWGPRAGSFIGFSQFSELTILIVPAVATGCRPVAGAHQRRLARHTTVTGISPAPAGAAQQLRTMRSCHTGTA